MGVLPVWSLASPAILPGHEYEGLRLNYWVVSGFAYLQGHRWLCLLMDLWVGRTAHGLQVEGIGTKLQVHFGI